MGERRNPPTIADAIARYDQLAEDLVPLYAGFGFENFASEHAELLKSCTSPVLDIGAGSGVHAAGLSDLGFEIYAVEPSSGMRNRARVLYSEKSVTWIDDRLPELSTVTGLNLKFGFVLINAVWMHLPPGDRMPALRKIASLLQPAAVLSVLIRLGPAPEDRPMHDVDPAGFIDQAHQLNMELVMRGNHPNTELPGVSYERLCFRGPE